MYSKALENKITKPSKWMCEDNKSQKKKKMIWILSLISLLHLFVLNNNVFMLPFNMRRSELKKINQISNIFHDKHEIIVFSGNSILFSLHIIQN